MRSTTRWRCQPHRRVGMLHVKNGMMWAYCSPFNTVSHVFLPCAQSNRPSDDSQEMWGVVTSHGSLTSSHQHVPFQSSGLNVGPWVAVCTRCATDYDTPWLDTSGAAAVVSVASRFYRTHGFNLDGQAGAWSDVVQATAARPSWFLPAWGN